MSISPIRGSVSPACWWTGPGGGESGGRNNDVVIGRWTNPQQADGDGRDGARENDVIGCGKNIGGIL